MDRARRRAIALALALAAQLVAPGAHAEDYPAVLASLSPVVERLAREVTPSGSASAGRKS